VETVAQRKNVAFLVLFGAAVVVTLFVAALYMTLVFVTDRDFSIGDAVAVVDIQGEIAYDLRKVEEIERYRDDSRVKALVLCIDSPGGGVAASQALYHAVRKVSEQKPVVASMCAVAASGGYYVACAADSIVAHEGTVTGSIGVLAAYLRTEELFHKVGLDVTVIKSGELKDVGSPYRRMTDEEKTYVRALLDEVYDQFITAVSDGRGLSVERVRELAEGRLYTGRQAVEVGLVDRVGTYEDALLMAAEMGGIAGRPHVVKREPERRLLDRFLGRFAGIVPVHPEERVSLKYIIP
jgi:protease-4